MFVLVNISYKNKIFLIVDLHCLQVYSKYKSITCTQTIVDLKCFQLFLLSSAIGHKRSGLEGSCIVSLKVGHCSSKTILCIFDNI